MPHQATRWQSGVSMRQASLGFGKRGLLEKGSFQKSPFFRDSREFRDSRDSRESPDCGKQRRLRPFSRDSREFRDFRDSRESSSEKTPFVMTPFFEAGISRQSSACGLKRRAGFQLSVLEPGRGGVCETTCCHRHCTCSLQRSSGTAQTQRKTQGQQLKGKIVSALFHTFWHFSTHFRTLFHTFSSRTFS